jgi:hypothetical protein
LNHSTGIAAFGNAPTAAIPAIILITIIGFFSGYGFSLIGRVCSYTGGKSYSDAWSESVGSDSSWIPAVTCTMKTCFAVLSYSMILADTMKGEYIIKRMDVVGCAFASSLLTYHNTHLKPSS